jgi:hypothetical protein
MGILMCNKCKSLAGTTHGKTMEQHVRDSQPTLLPRAAITGFLENSIVRRSSGASQAGWTVVEDATLDQAPAAFKIAHDCVYVGLVCTNLFKYVLLTNYMRANPTAVLVYHPDKDGAFAHAHVEKWKRALTRALYPDGC